MRRLAQPVHRRTTDGRTNTPTHRAGAEVMMRARSFHHNVYVVELDRAVLRDARFHRANPGHKPELPCLYVGSTGLPPGERFQNHKAGIKANRYVRDFGLGLLPEMFECFNPMPYAAALELERDLAQELREKGYAVWQG